MARLFAAIIIATLLVVLVTGDGERKKALKKRGGIQITSNADVFQWICQVSGNGYTFCTANTATSSRNTPSTTSTPGRGPTGKDTTSSATTRSSSPSESSSVDTSATTSASTTKSSTSSSSTPSALELAHWCQYAATGAWLPFNHTFMHLPCVMCHCAANHDIVCNELQCMDLHCIDGTVPRNISGQCCPQCAYETVSTTCRMNGLTFPHGTRVTTVENNVECWCQSGSIECRKVVTDPSSATTNKPMTTTKGGSTYLFYSEDSYLPDGMTAYIVVIIVCIVLMLGALLCCGCALAYYYYYQTQQQNMQQAYEQYYNNAGWQPVGVDGVTAEEKQAEAAAAQQGDFAAHYPTGQSQEYIPPPYAVYSGPYEAKPQGQNQV